MEERVSEPCRQPSQYEVLILICQEVCMFLDIQDFFRLLWESKSYVCKFATNLLSIDGILKSESPFRFLNSPSDTQTTGSKISGQICWSHSTTPILQYDSCNKRWPVSVATSPAFPRPSDRAHGRPRSCKSYVFTKKPFC